MNSLLALPKGALASLLVFSFFSNLLMLTVPFYMLQVFDRVLSSRSVETLWMLTIIAVAALLTAAVLEAIRSRLLLRVSNSIYGRWGADFLSGFGSGSTAESAGRLKDLADVRGFLMGGGALPALDAPWIPLYILVLFLFDPVFGWVAIAGCLLIAAVVGISEARTRGPIAEAQSQANQTISQAELITRNADTVKALGMIGRVTEMWSQRSMASLKASHEISASSTRDSAAAKFIRMFIQIAVLGLAAYKVTLGELTPGVMIAGSILITRALAPLEAAINGWRPMIYALQAYQRISEAVLAAPKKGNREVQSLHGKLKLERVTTIINRQQVLNNVSFSVEPGELIAVIGGNAAGKTTLVRTILGLVPPTLGKVYIDGIEAPRLNYDLLSEYIGYVAQQPPLFPGTVAENIARMEKDPDMDQVEIAARRAHSHDFFLGLPDGYETRLEELPPSQGYVKRIALARALYGEPRLVLLDEPEAHLDGEGNAALLRTISALKHAKVTTIVVTHRQDVAALADRAFAMQNGQMKIGVRTQPEALEHTEEPPAAQNPQTANVTQLQTAARAQGSPAEGPTIIEGAPPAPAPGGTVVQRKAPPRRGRETPRSAGASAARPGVRRGAQGRAPQKSRKEQRQEHRRVAARRPPRADLLDANRETINNGEFTLNDLLDPNKGSLGNWIVQSMGDRVGPRYLRRLCARVEPVLYHTLDEINADAMRNWRLLRMQESNGTGSIERAMEKQRFDKDADAVRSCLARALEWRLINEHPLFVDSKRADA